jgi:hypothetical protein
LGIVLFAGLVFVGIPGPVLNPALKEFLPEGWKVQADRLLLKPGTGWVLEQITLYAPRNHVTPWLVVQRAQADVDAFHRLRSGEWRFNLAMVGGDVDTNLGFWADDLQTDQPLHIADLSGKMYMDPHEIRIPEISGVFSGIRVVIKGQVDLDKLRDDSEDPSDSSGGGIQEVARQLAPAVNYLDDFSFSRTPDLLVNIEPGSGPASPVEVHILLKDTGPASYRGFTFTGLNAEVNLKDQVLDIRELEIQEDVGEVFSLTGMMDLEKRTIALKLQNSLKRYSLEAISPFSLDELLGRLQVRVEGRTDFRLDIPESRLDEIGSSITGEFSLSETFYKDTFFPKLAFSLNRMPGSLSVSDVEGILGKGKGKGPISGDISLSDSGESFRIDIQGAFYPEEAISLLGANSERLVRDWEFKGETPKFSLEYTKQQGVENDRLSVRLDAKDAICRGTQFQSVGLNVSMEDGMVRITDLNAMRGTQALEGELSFPMSLREVTMNVMSTFPPQDLAPFFGKRIEQMIQPIQFEGSNWMQLEGTVDLSSDNQHDLKGKFVFNQLIWEWVKFNHISSSFELEKEALSFPDIEGRLVEGELNGQLFLTQLMSDDTAFRLNLGVKQMDMLKTITAATDTEDTPYTGKLGLNLELAGSLESTPEQMWYESLSGKGDVEIKEGTLFRVPLLLGLSGILNKVVGGFGYASQTDFTAKFNIKDGVLKSDDLFLKGNVLSVSGDGGYEFGGKLEANMRVQLFSSGILSDALKVLLWPIRKLIEVQLTGTLDQPDWQPRNLPKELFGK